MSDKLIANILSGEKQKAFLLRSGIRQGCPLSPLLVNIVLEVLTRAIRQEILRTPHTHTHTQKLFKLINKFSKVVGYKINTQKSVAFLNTNN